MITRLCLRLSPNSAPSIPVAQQGKFKLPEAQRKAMPSSSYHLIGLRSSPRFLSMASASIPNFELSHASNWSNGKKNVYNLVSTRWWKEVDCLHEVASDSISERFSVSLSICYTTNLKNIDDPYRCHGKSSCKIACSVTSRP